MKERPILFRGEMVRAILDGRKTQTRRVMKPQPTHELQSDSTPECGHWEWEWKGKRLHAMYCPYGVPGDRLWVRETFILENAEKPLSERPFMHDEEAEWEWGNYLVPHYRATEAEPHIVNPRYDDGDDRTRWSPCIIMPRWASRITLEVTGVRAERVQDISEKDAIAEGTTKCEFDGNGVHRGYSHKTGFRKLWDSINAKPKPVWHDPYTQDKVECYVSCPWDRKSEVREHRGLPWYIVANPWVWIVEFKRIEE